MKNYNFNRINQKGSASLVFVLLVSLVVLASTSQAFKTIKNTQEIGTALNAVSHAETGTWTAAEAFRLYLERITTTEMLTLSSTIPIDMDPIYGSLSAEDVTVIETSANVFQIDATFVNRHAAARSSAKLQAVYNVSSAVPPTAAWPEEAVVSFNDDLEIAGSIELFNNGDPVDLVVDGNVTLGGLSSNPINELHATGKVNIGSKLEVGAIFANDDVTLANTETNIVRTMGDFLATGSASIASVSANGDVVVNASGDFGFVSTLKNITIQSGSGKQGKLLAGEEILVKSTGGFESASAIGDISLTNWFKAGDVLSMGDITCTSVWWNQVDSLIANGSLINCPPSSASVHTASGASAIVTEPAPITPITLSTQVIDVWPLKPDANYVIEYDTDLNRIKVTPNAVEGLWNGAEYYLGQYSVSGAPYKDYLCRAVDTSGNCTVPSAPTMPLCFGQSLYNSCISYDTGTETFSVNPNQTAPGVMFFDGNVKLSNGHSITSILATGDITTSGQFVHWAANRGAYSKVCEAEASHAKSSVRSRYTEAYSKHYPSNLCDVANSTYNATVTANIGLAAGGYNPDTDINPGGLYYGGDIDLGASTEVVGAVLAGNILKTSGQVVIQGVVAAGAHGDTSSGSNSLGSSTTIDFSSTTDYNAVGVPSMGAAVPTGGEVTTAVMLWSRPL